MQQRAGDLGAQPSVQAVDQVPDVILDVSDVESLATTVARVDHVLQVLDRRHDFFILGQRAVIEMVEAADGRVRGDDLLGQRGEIWLRRQGDSHRG